MSVLLVDIECPLCNKVCWINNGDIDDCTAPDVEAVRCWNCPEVFWIDKEYKEMHEESAQPIDYAEKSFPSAKEAL